MSDPVNPTTNPNQNDPVKTDPVDVSALEAEIKALKSDNEKLRKANTEASADASKWKKQFQDTLSEADRVKAEQEEAAAAMQKEIARLQTNERTAILSSVGFDADVSEAVITAFNDGNFEGLVDGIRKFIDSHDKTLKESMIQNNPTIESTGKSGKTMTKAEIMAIRDPVVRQQKIAENVELFT